jgi:hypothetical protein
MKTTTIILSVLVCAFALIGCAAGEGQGSLDESAVDEEPNPLDAAVALRAAPETLPFCELAEQRWFDAAGLIIRCHEGPGMLVAWDVMPPELAEYGGYADPQAGSVVMSREYEHAWGLIATHEIGHLLRSGHPANGSLMNRQPAGVGVPITQEDLAYICEARFCPWQIPESADSEGPRVEAVKQAVEDVRNAPAGAK